MPRVRPERNAELASVTEKVFSIESIAPTWARERPELSLRNMLITVYLVRLGRIIELQADKEYMARYGLQASHVRVLTALRRAGQPFAARPTDLFNSLMVTSGAMTKQVDKLETVGLVERLPDPTYARGFLVQLTKKGKIVADQAVDYLVHESAITRILNEMPKKEVDRLEVTLLELLKSAKSLPA